MNYLVSIYLWVMYGLTFVIIFPIALVVFVLSYPFDKNRELTNALFMLAGRSFPFYNPFWKIEYFGLDKVDKKNNDIIFVGNHQSFLDMPVSACLPWNMKWVSKKELFKLPLVGLLMKMSGHVSIDRGKTTAVQSLFGIVKHLENKIPVMVYPEGTRSRDGKLKPFKKGAFIIAHKHNYRIQPLVIYGTNKLIKPDTWKISSLSGKIYISILGPISPNQFETDNELKEHTHRVMHEELLRLESLYKSGTK